MHGDLECWEDAHTPRPQTWFELLPALQVINNRRRANYGHVILMYPDPLWIRETHLPWPICEGTWVSIFHLTLFCVHDLPGRCHKQPNYNLGRGRYIIITFLCLFDYQKVSYILHLKCLVTVKCKWHSEIFGFKVVISLSFGGWLNTFRQFILWQYLWYQIYCGKH